MILFVVNIHLQKQPTKNTNATLHWEQSIASDRLRIPYHKSISVSFPPLIGPQDRDVALSLAEEAVDLLALANESDSYQSQVSTRLWNIKDPNTWQMLKSGPGRGGAICRAFQTHLGCQKFVTGSVAYFMPGSIQVVFTRPQTPQFLNKKTGDLHILLPACLSPMPYTFLFL